MKIKKICLAISLAVCSVSAFAQGQEVKSVEFNPHGYLQLQGGVGMTLGEAEFTDLLSPAAAPAAITSCLPLPGSPFL